MTTVNKVTYTVKRTVSCDGGEGAEGHPKVYLYVKPEMEYVVCPYCSHKFCHKEK